MGYTEIYKLLKEQFNQNYGRINLSGFNQEILNIDCHAHGYYDLPGVNRILVDSELVRSAHFEEREGYKYSRTDLNESFSISDACMPENINFRYILVKHSDDEKCRGVIMLLHGLNEKSWEKYLVWATTLQSLTGKAVLLFPITYHMNRAPAKWSDRHLMNAVAEERKTRFGLNECCSFANAAISTRLHFRPHRFFFSGFQTYFDILNLITTIRTGIHEHIAQDASIDLFSYSIGSFLSEILFLDNYNNYFAESKMCLFCGGTTADGFTPVTKTIMDRLAFESFHSFYCENFDDEVHRNPIMSDFYKYPSSAALSFKTMLNYNWLREFRETRLRTAADRILALPLRQDSVIPCSAVEKTLHGADCSIPVKVEIKDFPYKYTHETPFPVNSQLQKMVDHCFDELFTRIAQFFIQ